MKTKNLLSIMLVVSIVFFSSCKKDDDAETCSPCHIALDMDGTEMKWSFMNSEGGTDFCGQELTDTEASSFVYSVTDTMWCDDNVCALPPGDYGPGTPDNPDYEIHCEDHGDHDH